VEVSIATEQEAKLIRALGVPSLAANIINTTIGAGIFVLPAVAAKQLGAASPLAFLVCAIAMCLVVTSFAMAGSRVSLTGGLYAYVEVALGRYVGFLAGVLFCVTAVLSVSGVVNVFAGSVGILIPALATGIARFFLILFVFGSLAVINIRGVRAGARAVDIVTLAKIAPLIIFVIAGIFFIRPSAMAWPGWPGSKALGESVIVVIFAFAGIEVALVPSGEVKNPARTVPRAIYIALAVTTLLYVMIQLVGQGVLGNDLANYPDAPLAEAAAQFLGNFGRSLMLAGAAMSAFGFVTSDILSSPRILFAFGRDGILPGWFANTHSRSHAPHVAIIIYSAIAFVCALSSTFQQLAVLANVAVLLLYFLCCLATLKLAGQNIRGDGQPFHFPGANLIPVLAIIVIIWILAHATVREFAVNAACLAIASVLFFVRRLFTRKTR
jgi:APA family basic amino acid/polyamine antiporter